jgi:hypothetical protein
MAKPGNLRQKKMATKMATISEEEDSPTVVFRGRSYPLFKRGDEESPWWVRVQKSGGRISRSCDTAETKLATVRAKLIIGEILDGRVDEPKEKVIKSAPTINEILEFGKASHLAVRSKTQGTYGNALLFILHTVNGCTKEQAKNFRLDVLTSECEFIPS